MSVSIPEKREIPFEVDALRDLNTWIDEEFQSLRKGKYPSKKHPDGFNVIRANEFQSLRKGKYPSK